MPRGSSHNLSPAVLVGLALVMSLNTAASAQVTGPVSLGMPREQVATTGEKRQTLAYWVGLASDAAKTLGLTPDVAITAGDGVPDLPRPVRTGVLPPAADLRPLGTVRPAPHLIDLPPPM